MPRVIGRAMGPPGSIPAPANEYKTYGVVLEEFYANHEYRAIHQRDHVETGLSGPQLILSGHENMTASERSTRLKNLFSGSSRMGGTGNGFATVEYNPWTRIFRNFKFQTGGTYPLLLGRALTAVSTDGGDEARCYVPSDPIFGVPRTPMLEVKPGSCSTDAISSVTEWIVQPSNYAASRQDICFDLEWTHTNQNFVPALSSTYRTFPIVGGLNPPPGRIETNNTFALSSQNAVKDLVLRGSIAHRDIGSTGLTRPRTRNPLAGGTISLPHHDRDWETYY